MRSALPSSRSYLRSSNCAAVAVLFLLGSLAVTRADTLSDNLSTPNTGSEAVLGDTWIAASFATNSSQYSLSSATLLLANTAPGTAELDLYSDLGQPASLVSMFTPPAFYTSVLSPSTFTSNNYLLAPNSTYWLVLKAPSGEFDWGWTSSSTGSGVGFTHTWGASDDAGASWFTSDIEPMQFSVSASPASAVPEPAYLLPIGLGAALLIFAAWSRLRPRAQACPPAG